MTFWGSITEVRQLFYMENAICRTHPEGIGNLFVDVVMLVEK
jgi:hypothetical protein